MSSAAERQQDLDRFNAELVAAAERMVPEHVAVLTRKLALELLRRIVFKTPVDTGHARHNWQASVGSPVEAEIPGADSGDAALVRAEGELRAVRPFDVAWLANSVPYILVLEEGGYPTPGGARDTIFGEIGPDLSPKPVNFKAGNKHVSFVARRKQRVPKVTADGYSLQAPHGMVAESLLEMESAFAAPIEDANALQGGAL